MNGPLKRSGFCSDDRVANARCFGVASGRMSSDVRVIAVFKLHDGNTLIVMIVVVRSEVLLKAICRDKLYDGGGARILMQCVPASIR